MVEIGPGIPDTVEYRLAIKVVNLRRALKVANKFLHEDGKLGVLCQENDGPTFRGGRRFWKEVRVLAEDRHGS